MNYDLAIMALDGLTRAPMKIRVESGDVVIEGPGASFKELARLCLLMGGERMAAEDAFELQPGRHLSKDSPKLTLKLA